MDIMEPVDNNLFEVIPTKNKRKITTPCPNAYLNPALDLLANEDPMCNTAMEIVPNKKRRTRSCDIATFENSALDLGISKTAINEFLVCELENVRKNVRSYECPAKNLVDDSVPTIDVNEPIYTNLTETNGNSVTENNIINYDAGDVINAESTMEVTDVPHKIELDSCISSLEHKSLPIPDNTELELSAIKTTTQTNVTNKIFINNTSNLSLSFIDRLALDSPSLSNQSLILDDDLNESNIMEIKTITIITKKKRIDKKKNTNPFLNGSLDHNSTVTNENPFLTMNTESEYTGEYSMQTQNAGAQNLMPRRLFTSDINSTISTVNESVHQHEYENIDNYQPESPIYENMSDENETHYNKQSKILGYDVSQFNATDIMNLNKLSNQSNSSTESNENKKHLKHQILRVSNKLSKKVLKTLKKTFKAEHKPDNNVTLNPYEVPRKHSKQKSPKEESGIENPALNLDNSDEIEIEELDDEHQYETIKTLRNTKLNMNVTPLKVRVDDNDCSLSKPHTPGKKVRFDSTLNQEKVITGNSFDLSFQSPDFDVKIDKYHDELENCINEKKFLQQNM